MATMAILAEAATADIWEAFSAGATVDTAVRRLFGAFCLVSRAAMGCRGAEGPRLGAVTEVAFALLPC